MKDQKYYNNLEQFLQSKTAKHKLYPEDKVWRNIYKEFHGNEKWHALPFVSLFIISALTISSLIYNNPTKSNFSTLPIIENNVVGQNKLVSKNLQFNEQYLTHSFSYPIKTKKQNHIIASTPNQNKIKSNNEFIISEEININNRNSINSVKLIANNNSVDNNFSANNNTEDDNLNIKETEKSTEYFLPILLQKNINHTTEIKKINPSFSNNYNNTLYKTTTKNLKQKPTKFELQFYSTPSISFRRLTDDKTRNIISLRNANPSGPLSSEFFTDVNDVVRHKPALGLEAGIGILYQLTDKIKLRTGFQLNLRKYYIDSYKSGINVAQIAIVTNNGIDTVKQLSNTSNTSGYATTTLKNKLYQASIPIGIQWQILQKNNFGISLGASIQPTLTLNKNVYILSTDYKFYSDGTSFFRKWNINTDIDISFTYKLGNYNLFISPQIRYQHLPTYIDDYPIKEYRLDNGLRIGFTKQIFK